MADISIKIDTKELTNIRSIAKEKGLNQKRLVVAAMRVGMSDKKKLLEEYLNVN